MFLLSLNFGDVRAQNPCNYNSATVTLPASLEVEFGTPGFEICELGFTATVNIQHEYPVNTAFTVSFTFNPAYFNVSGTTPSVTLTPGTDIFGNTVLTGTFTVPSDGEFGEADLLVHFSRVGTWSSNDAEIRFVVSDPACPNALLDDHQGFAVEPYADLRPFAETSLNQLIATGAISPTITGALPNILIDNELVIDIPASFVGSTGIFREVVLMPGASIRIATDASVSGLTPNLFLSEANVHTCPGSALAEGIVIDPQNTSGFPLTKLTVQNSIVSDCRHGVSAKPNSSFRLENVQFVNNYIGLNLNMSGASPGQERVRIDGFSGVDFLSDAPLKEPYPGMPEQVETRGYCGIRLNGYRDFNVFGGATFSRLANGIVGTNSIGNLGNMAFSDIKSADAETKYPHEGFGIRLQSKAVHWFNLNEFWTNMAFDDCKTGIYASNYALNVENTKMTNLDVGIDVSRSKMRDIVLDGNTITARKYGIRSGLNEPLHPISAIRNNKITITGGLTPSNDLTKGIEMQEIGAGSTVAQPLGNDGWEVSGNEVTMEQGGNGILYRNGLWGSIQGNEVKNESQPNNYTGILTEGTTFSDFTANTIDQLTSAGLGTATAIYSSGGFANTFQCNCVDNTNVGMQFNDVAEFTDAVRGNGFSTHCTGLQLGFQGVGGAYIGEQSHRGNLWDLSAITGTCLGGRNWSVIELSPFLVNGTANAALNPAVFPSSGWFTNQSGTTYNGCGNCVFPPQMPPRVTESDVPTKLDEAIAKDMLLPEVFEDEMNWKGAYRLYRKILRRPAIETYSTDFEDFVSANENLSTGKLAFIAEEKAKIFVLSTTEGSTLENYRLNWRTEIAQLKGLDSLRQAGNTVNQGQYEDAVEESAEAQDEYKQYIDGLVLARQTQIQTLLTLNAAVSVSLTPAVNHKTVNTIVLNFLLTDTLATGNLATLESIAEQCPLEGGDAVYEARAIVSYYTGADFSDAELCEEALERQQQPDISNKIHETGSVLLYPNPTTGHLFWNGTNVQPVTIRVFNALGQLAVEQTNVIGQTNLGQLPEGLYQIQLLSSDNTVLATQKLQVIKH